jgi:hypothetical protein
MKLDLRRDCTDFYAYLADRVRGYDPATNDGPGGPGVVRVVQVGFEYSQSGWVAVVFDTRPDAEPDGEWNSHIEGNTFERPEWVAVGEANLDGPVTLVRPDGTETELPEGTELAEPLGQMLTEVLLRARADGLFSGLPKAEACKLAVEHHEGAYGWPDDEARGEEDLA